jgi:DNA polymerase-3 subunit epsilon
MKLQLTRPLVFFDLETTGVDISKDQIVEISIARLSPGSVSPQITTFRLNPGIPIPPGATAIHGIKDADVTNCPRLEQKSNEILEIFAGCDIGGYNVLKFDLPFLRQKLAERGHNLDVQHISTVDPMAVFHKKEERNLAAAYRYYCGKTLENAHSAEADTLAALEIFLAQVDRYNDIGSTVSEVAEYCSNGQKYADYDRKLKYHADGDVVYAFGKHIGKKVKDELGYAAWMIDNDFTAETKMLLKAVMEKYG